MQIKGCGPKEYESTIRMLNGVYGKAFGLPPRLQERHPLLLGRGNMENMRIALVDGVPVSAFNFCEAVMLVEGVPVRAASVGCVGTDDNFRGRNLASLLMDDAEEKMRQDGVRLEIISGGRSLYTRKGASHAGRYLGFELPAGGSPPPECSVAPYAPELLGSLAGLYAGESTRFYRSLDDFRLLVDSGLMPWAGADAALLCVMRGGGPEAYVFIRVERSRSAAVVREFAGNRELIAGSLRYICGLAGMDTIRVACPRHDPLIRALSAGGWSCKPVEWMGTVKVLDFEGLMADLLPYFRQHVPGPAAGDIGFSESPEGYSLRIRGEEAVIKRIEELNGLVLGSAGDDLSYRAQGGALRAFFERAFPLPFPWCDNLNIQ